MAVRNATALRSELEAEQGRLLAMIAQMEIESDENLGYGNHMADDATEAFEQAKDLALLQNAQRLLEQVGDALGRLDDGTYGTCENCGTPIDPARLEALPYVTLCLRCAQRLEG
jgi:RNA polymerase-binding transcription factor